MIEKIDITSHAEWLNLRRLDVTASVAGALLGVHDYQTRYALFALKHGDLEEDVETSGPMMRGVLLEPVALQLLRIERPDWKLEWNGTPGTIGGHYYRDPKFRIGATPDCFAVDPQRGRGVVQVKTTVAQVFREKWFQSGDFYDSEEAPMLAPPLWVAVQAITEAYLTGAQWAAVAVLVIGHGLDLHIIDIPIHTGIINRIRDVSLEFWDRVARNDPYPPDYSRDGETIAALYGQDNGKEIDLRGDNLLPALLEEREKAMAVRKLTQKRLDEIKAELIHKLGPNIAGYLPGWEITYKPTHRKAYMVAETTYRTLRVKKEKD
jgi:predicted phage-related endonuclease